MVCLCHQLGLICVTINLSTLLSILRCVENQVKTKLMSKTRPTHLSYLLHMLGRTRRFHTISTIPCYHYGGSPSPSSSWKGKGNVKIARNGRDCMEASGHFLSSLLHVTLSNVSTITIETLVSSGLIEFVEPPTVLLTCY